MTKRSILLVDDEDIIRASINQDLKNAGYEVVVAENGDSAYAKLREASFDLIITDLMMEGMGGVQLLKKARELNPEALVIIITGFASLNSALECMRAGAFDYLLKPCGREDLLLRVTRAVERLELVEQAKRHTIQIETSNTELQRAISRHLELEKSLEENQAQLKQSNEMLKRISLLDGLTEIANRRSFDEYLAREWSLAARHSLSMSLIFIDVDHFKAFNDAYGHQPGDDCLRQIAGATRKNLKRPADMAARYGGEEFVAFLPGALKDGALILADQIHGAVESLKIPHAHSPVADHVTISLGVATIVPDKGSSPSDLVKLADLALYKAKQQGRNQVAAG